MYYILNLKMGGYALDNSNGNRIAVSGRENLESLVHHWAVNNQNGKWLDSNIHPNCTSKDFVLICTKY